MESVNFSRGRGDTPAVNSFQANCTEAAAFVKQCCRAFPPLAKLIFVLKQYLSLHGLNEVFHGGISSYSLTLMIVSPEASNCGCDFESVSVQLLFKMHDS